MKKLLKVIGEWAINNILRNKYHALAVIFTIIAIYSAVFIVRAEMNNTLTVLGYLISASSIYSSILFAYLLQKVSKIRLEKERLLNDPQTKDLFVALLNYRFFCYLIERLLNQKANRQYQTISRLKISLSDLILIDNSMTENIDKENLSEYNDFAKKNQDAPLHLSVIIKFCLLFSDKIASHINTNDRVFYSNNTSINKYISVLISDSPINKIKDMPAIPIKEELLAYLEKQLVKKPQYAFFQDKIDWENDDVLKNLINIERYILNKALFRLYSVTFVIENKLPNPTICLLINLIVILFVGTILPMINFFINSPLLNNISISTTIVAISLSLFYIWNIFRDENDNDLHKYSSIIYEGKSG